MLVYLFRDESGSNALAYSTDVTGRNIPRPSERTAWAFVTATLRQDIHDEEAMRHLRDHSFYIFQSAPQC